MDWEGLREMWPLVWPVVRQMLIALLVTILSLLGYDTVVPSRFVRKKEGDLGFRKRIGRF